MMSSALGQCFQLAFQLFLQINGIPPPSDTEAVQELAEVYHDDLVHYSKVDMANEVSFPGPNRPSFPCLGPYFQPLFREKMRKKSGLKRSAANL